VAGLCGGWTVNAVIDVLLVVGGITFIAWFIPYFVNLE
jgi:hypothetical protein